jgi:probable rRNA maturation factor|tara:strand:+ start:155 stop:601 length:447 start_codon:yes stop_codon:yes gene_type:complete
MSVTIEINQSGVKKNARFPEDHITRVAKKTLKAIKKNNVHLSIALVTPEDIRKINKEYRGKDKSTDVLSFQLEKEKNTVEKNAYWGEVIICPTVAKKQAHLFFNTYEKEMSRLLVHGILHIAGYDHHTNKEKTIMFGLTDRILATLRT